jgi:hypothetical protein
MNQPWTQLRRAMLAFAFVGTLGFGATQAFAVPEQARFRSCALYPEDECYAGCTAQGWDYGYCDRGQCKCINLE